MPSLVGSEMCIRDRYEREERKKERKRKKEGSKELLRGCEQSKRARHQGILEQRYMYVCTSVRTRTTYRSRWLYLKLLPFSPFFFSLNRSFILLFHSHAHTYFIHDICCKSVSWSPPFARLTTALDVLSVLRIIIIRKKNRIHNLGGFFSQSSRIKGLAVHFCPLRSVTRAFSPGR